MTRLFAPDRLLGRGATWVGIVLVGLVLVMPLPSLPLGPKGKHQILYHADHPPSHR
jgi:hypothetical protein